MIGIGGKTIGIQLGDPITRLNTNRFTTYTYQTSSPVVDRDNALPEHVLVGNAYHDGLGRLIERVDKQASPSGKDLVMAYQYDALGRNAKQYLPFESTDNNGDPVAQPYMRQQTFYETTDGVAYSSLPFSLSDYESSPLDRIREYAPPGEEWAGTILSANARSIKTTYGANAAGEVIKWEIGSALPHRQYDYPVNELSKTVTIDEEGNKVIEFADKFGQVILKRVQANESADLWADTYYLYDVYGSLHYVLPPMATANLTEYLAGDDVQKQKFLDRWAFQYHYDTRRRLVKKRVPGADWVYMVYDQRDRLVLTQDGNQRLTDEWLFTKYDALNRPVITGLYTNTDTTIDSREAMQNLVNGHTVLTESVDANSAYLGYTNNAFPDALVEDYLTVTYYDNYDFHHANLVDYGFVPSPENPTYFNKVKGQVTGSMTKVLYSDQWLRSVIYYDDRYRAIQQVSDNAVRGIDRIENEYDFVGRALKTTSSHQRPQPILWTNQQNIKEESGVFSATSAGGWQSGMSSINRLGEGEDGWFETIITTNLLKRFGLNEEDTGVGGDADYYLYSLGNRTDVYFGSTVAGSFEALQVGDVVRMERKAGTISIYLNGDWKHDFTTTSTSSLVIDVSLYVNSSMGYFTSSFGMPQAESPYPVFWTGLSLMNSTGSGLIKNVNGWNGNASSVNRLESLENGWLEFEAVTTDKNLIVGLSESDLDKSYASIEYGIYLKSNGDAIAYEKGSGQSTPQSYQSGDVFRIERTGQQISYSKNGVVFHHSSTPSTTSLIADMAFNNQGGEVTNIKSSFYLELPKAQDVEITREFDYDHASRLINTWHALSEPAVLTDSIGIEVMGKKITKNVPIALNNSGFTSQQVMGAQSNGWVEVEVVETNKSRTFGLSETPNGQGANAIDYAINLAIGQVIILENGVTRATINGYSPGDVFRVRRQDGTIYYEVNDSTLTTSTISSTTTLRGDFSLLHEGATFYNVRMSTEGNVLLAHNEYNALGELIEKNLHSTDEGTTYAQSVDYRYNIRGWITRINDSGLSETESQSAGDYFGMNLAYNETLTGINNTAAYNGNISAITYSHNLGLEEQKEKAYAYGYDPMNRIKTADYKKKTAAWANSAAFSVNNISYDLNGNINTLTRNKADGSGMDILTYDYGTGINQSNQLLSVSDGGDDLEGFKDGNTSGDDYDYDANGNMTQDLNKGITRITYNHLNLPHTIEKDDGQRMRYVYDAAGIKLSQVVEQGIVHTPDLTNGTDGWSLKNISFEQHAGPIGGETDLQSITAQTTATNHYRQFHKLLDLQGKSIKVEAKVMIPSSNGSVNGLRVYIGTNYQNFTPTADQWVNISYTIEANNNSMKLIMTTDGNYQYVSLGDVIYFKDFKYTVYEGKTTDYVGEFIYENDALQLIQHEEGRIVPDPTTGSWEYQYHLKDHLGNTQVSFTSKPKEIVFNVSYEGNSDEFLFEEMDNLVDADMHDYQHPDEQTNHSWTQKLTGAPNSQVGSVLSIPVGPGDKISAEVFAKYIDTDTASNPSALIASLLTTAFTGGTGINNELTNQAINTSFNGGSFITNPANNQTYDANGVMAFLNLLFLPEEAQATVSQEHFAFQQVNTSATSHEQLSINNFIAPKAGYVLVYLSNEDPTYTEVFFDDLKITLNEHPVIQMDSYYPFGLTHSNGYQRVTNLKNRFLYNEGTERIEALDLGVDFTPFRVHDPSIGRWWQIDPIEKFHESGYAWVTNNPILWNDPFGLDTLNSSAEGFNWDDVKPGDVVDGTQVLNEVIVSDEEVPAMLPEGSMMNVKNVPGVPINTSLSTDYQTAQNQATAESAIVLFSMWQLFKSQFVAENHSDDPNTYAMSPPIPGENFFKASPRIFRATEMVKNSKVKRIADSMKKLGWVGKPIQTYALRDGTQVILNGHHRVKAAAKAGIDVHFTPISLEEAKAIYNYASELEIITSIIR